MKPDQQTNEPSGQIRELLQHPDISTSCTPAFSLDTPWPCSNLTIDGPSELVDALFWALKSIEIEEADPSMRIIRRPMTKHAPKWARWKAQDADGAWHWFENRPRYNKKLGTWTAIRGDAQAV